MNKSVHQQLVDRDASDSLVRCLRSAALSYLDTGKEATSDLLTEAATHIDKQSDAIRKLVEEKAALSKIAATESRLVNEYHADNAEHAEEIASLKAQLDEAVASQCSAPMRTDPTGCEIIVAAAVRIPVDAEFREKVWLGERSYPDHMTVTAPPPARHHTLLHPLYDYIGRDVPSVDQGFITSTGRFVDREEGLRIALASGQPMIDHPSRHDRLLFSEDLW